MPKLQQGYSVFHIDQPIPPAQLTAFKSLRLTALQTDPHAFSSNYAREAAFTEDVWRQRLDSPLMQTLVAYVSPGSEASRSESADGQGQKPGRETLDTCAVSELPLGTAGETGKWIGMAAIVGPTGVLPSTLAPFKQAGIVNWQIYGLYGMWVHPAHRSKGVGAQLVKACLEWARSNVDPAFVSANGGGDNDEFEKVVALLVYDNNIAGRVLYSRSGFTEIERVPAEQGQRWMVVKL